MGHDIVHKGYPKHRKMKLIIAVFVFQNSVFIDKVVCGGVWLQQTQIHSTIKHFLGMVSHEQV